MLFSKLNEYSKSKFVRDTFWGVLSTGVAALAGILIQTHIGNKLGSSSLGIFNKSMSFFLVLTTISCFSVTDSIVRFSSLNKHNLPVLSSYLKASVMLVFGISVVVVSISVLIIHFYSFDYNTAFIKFLSVQLCSIPLFIMNRIMLSCLNGLRKMQAYAILQMLRWLLLAGFIIILTLSGTDIILAGYAFLITESIIFCLCIVTLWKLIVEQIPFSAILDKAREISGYSKNLVAGSIVNDMSGNIDILVLSLFVTNSEIAIYSVALYVINGFLLLPNIIQLNFNPLIAEAIEHKDPYHFKDLVIKTRNMNILVMSLLAIVACVLFPVYIHFFMHKPEFSQSIGIFYILIPGAFISSIFSFLGAVFSMSGHPKLNSILVVIQFIIKTSLLLALVKYFSITGAAMAISFNYIIGIVIFAFAFKSVLRINFLEFNWGK